jgi:hypothetical protein
MCSRVSPATTTSKAPSPNGRWVEKSAPHRLHAEASAALLQRRLVDVERGHPVARGVQLQEGARAAADFQEPLAGPDPRGEQLRADAGGLVEADDAPVAVPLLVVLVELLQAIGH